MHELMCMITSKRISVYLYLCPKNDFSKKYDTLNHPPRHTHTHPSLNVSNPRKANCRGAFSFAKIVK